jgi:transcriptional regulator of acetoin/glycerol metabolism
MELFSDTHEDIARAWQAFSSKGELDSGLVRREIAQSWHRCKEAGVDPYSIIKGIKLHEQELNQRLRQKKTLMDIAIPFMQKLYEFVTGTGFVVILADEEGYILEMYGASDTVVKGKEINLVKGSRWVEEVTGTNGVGTALVLRAPIQVSGAEHYCQVVHEWTCSAAPIFDNSHQLVGVLQISGPSRASHQHTLGMVVAAVEAIEEQMQIQQQNRELILINNRLHSIFHTMSEGVVIINRWGLIEQVNPGAERIFKRPAEDLEGVYLKEIFKEVSEIKEMLMSGAPCADIEIQASWDGRQIHCFASGKAITDNEGKLNGGVLLLSPITKIRNLVNRFSGAHARFTFDDIIGSSPEIIEAVRIGMLAALNDHNVLLQGESGTGKEVFAQAIHNRSNRCNGPFVALNCAAIPRELLGSELFGYVEGAFTGAHRGGRPGKFELASGGTLFLDEIGDMTYGKQGALLRAIQEKAIIRIGDNRVIPVDVRIICASNKNLHEAVERGDFRRDLFYRLNVLKINLPPLRHHPEDVPQLFDYFVKQICQRQGVEIDDVNPAIVSALADYHWPGNVRELENIVERMVCMASGKRLEVQDLPAEVCQSAVNAGEELPHDHKGRLRGLDSLNLERERARGRKAREDQEKQQMMEVISRCGGNISRVAREMGFSRNTVYRKMRQYGISK